MNTGLLLPVTHTCTRISNESSKFYKVKYFAYYPNTLIYCCMVRDITGCAMAHACLCGDVSSNSDQSFMDLCWANRHCDRVFCE
jgi:hypothetical protein